MGRNEKGVSSRDSGRLITPKGQSSSDGVGGQAPQSSARPPIARRAPHGQGGADPAEHARHNPHGALGAALFSSRMTSAS